MPFVREPTPGARRESRRPSSHVGAWSAEKPARFVVIVLALLGALGLADRGVGLDGQLVLGAVTCGALIAALAPLSRERRIETMLVVVVATSAEVLASIVWGLYTYRLHNLPLFVPPGHGLVYLGGRRLSELHHLRRRPRLFVGAVSAAAVAWALAGMTVMPRTDVGGAIGVGVFLAFLARGDSKSVYAGVFVVVAFVELWGTAVGVWRWDALTPGLGLPMGNPPSGAASGYVLFDVVAIAVSTRLLRSGMRLRAPAVAGGS